jgi:hypothetical protein
VSGGRDHWSRDEDAAARMDALLGSGFRSKLLAEPALATV